MLAKDPAHNDLILPAFEDGSDHPLSARGVSAPSHTGWRPIEVR
jgi:hypothetical protein